MPVKAVQDKNGRWVVRDKAGKVHGTHGKDKAKAERQAKAINQSLSEAGKI